MKVNDGEKLITAVSVPAEEISDSEETAPEAEEISENTENNE